MRERLSPSSLWFWSCQLHKRGRRRSARALKLINFFVFRAVLPPEAELHGPVSLGHWGLGVVVHPNVTIGRDVHLWHQVTVATRAKIASEHRIVIGDGVEIGAGAKLVSPENGSLSIGAGARVGANAIVTKDVPPGSRVVGPQATVTDFQA